MAILTWLEVPLSFLLHVTWGAAYSKSQRNRHYQPEVPEDLENEDIVTSASLKMVRFSRGRGKPIV